MTRHDHPAAEWVALVVKRDEGAAFLYGDEARQHGIAVAAERAGEVYFGDLIAWHLSLDYRLSRESGIQGKRHTIALDRLRGGDDCIYSAATSVVAALSAASSFCLRSIPQR